jgi:integrase
MHASKLTETLIANAAIPDGKQQVFLWDGSRGGVTGFGVRILPGGSKTFWFQYRNVSGTVRMIRIGASPTVKLDHARKRGRDLAGQVARGKDPAAEKQEAKRAAGSTLRQLLATDGDYERHLKRRQVVNTKQALSSLRRGLARLMGREVSDLARADFVAVIAAIEDDGRPGAAQDLRKFSRTFLEWCVSSGRAHSNVLAGLRQPRRSRVERLRVAANGGRALSDDEIRKLWHRAGNFGSFGGLVRLALLTGLRRGELAQLQRRRDILPDRIVVQPEHAKSGNTHTVPLTPLMRRVIAAQPVTTSPLLFPSPVTGGRLKGWTRLVSRLQAASGVTVRLHDLRRTCRTLMSRLGVPEDAAELAIGHVRADLIARYNKDESWDGRRNAFVKVSAHIAALLGQPQETSRVVPLARRRH